MIGKAIRLMAGGSARGTIFVAGLVVGLGLGAFVTAAGSAEDVLSNFSRSVLYAIAELAVDTESNAASIVELSERIDKLEIALERLHPEQD